VLGLPRRTTRRNPPASLTSKGAQLDSSHLAVRVGSSHPLSGTLPTPNRSKDQIHIPPTTKNPNPLRRIGVFIPKPDDEPALRSIRNATGPPSPSEGHQHLGAGQVSWLAACLTLCAFPSNQLWVSGVRVSGSRMRNSKTRNSKLFLRTVAFSRFQCRLQLRGSNGLALYAPGTGLHRFPCFRHRRTQPHHHFGRTGPFYPAATAVSRK